WLGPMHKAAVEVGWVNQRRSVVLRVWNEELFGTEIHDTARRNIQSKLGEWSLQLSHLLSNGLICVRGDEVNEMLWVTRRNYFAVRSGSLRYLGACLAAACGDDYGLGFLRRFRRVDDDVLLQNFVMLEGGRARFENVQQA